MLITRKELDYYRNHDSEIEMYMEKLKKWQLILLRAENSYLYFEIPKKNGKSQLAAALGLYHTFADGAYDGEVYYCDGDHDNLTGEIGACKTADELREKVMELADAESNGVDEDSFNKLIEEYMKLIEKELDITEADYRKFGAADNTKAQEYYQKLIDEGAIPNNFWNVETPIGEEDSDE